MREKVEISVKRIFNILYYTIIVVLAATILTSVGSRIYSERTGEKPTVFGYTPTIVVSGSMLPTLEINSMNIIKNCGVQDVYMNDIVVYWSDELRINIIHRVIDIKYEDGEKKFITKGDNNPVADSGYVTSDNIVGKVVLTMNWLSPYVSKIMLPGNTGIDYMKLVEYMVLLTVLLWGVMSILYCIGYLIIAAIKRLTFGKLIFRD